MLVDAGTAPHRRFDPLKGEWILVSPHRNQRPWQGERAAADNLATPLGHDPQCYLCPGNMRANGTRNPDYAGTYVFDNDFPAMLADQHAPANDDPLLRHEPAIGTCRVICYAPEHRRTLSDLNVAELRAVIDTWCAETETLSARYEAVQIFENKGAMMGCSSPHPHGQVWATTHMPQLLATENSRQAAWLSDHGAPLLAMLAEREVDGPRMVACNADWLAIIPFWAAWPFETLLLPRRDLRRLTDLDDAARATLGAILGEVLGGYDGLFACSFPYSMGWHGAPTSAGAAPQWRVHAHFYPPLLRSATVRKHMVGFELLAEAQRDLTPEQAAEQLRSAIACARAAR